MFFGYIAGSQRSVYVSQQSGDQEELMPTKKATDSFNRPANTTAYSIGDSVSDSTAALAYTIAAGAGVIRRVRVAKSNEAVSTPTIRVWFYDASVTPVTDNSAFGGAIAQQNTLGYVDVDVIYAGNDYAVGQSDCDIPFEASTIYATLQTLTTFTPASAETFEVSFWYLAG